MYFFFPIFSQCFVNSVFYYSFGDNVVSPTHYGFVSAFYLGGIGIVFRFKEISCHGINSITIFVVCSG